MSDELADFYVHTITVETLQGTDGYGAEHFAAPVVLTPPATGCMIEQKRRLVRAKDGAEVISETTIYTFPAAASILTPGSRVTVRGEETRVITAALADSGDLDLPDHLTVALT